MTEVRSDHQVATGQAVDWEPMDVGGVPARVYRPAAPTAGHLVWAHGGSWIRGSVEGWHEPCADLARLSGCTLISVEYRLAPRHPHPAALNDVLAVLDWAAEQGGAVVVGGDSAGATIAASAALTLRDRGVALAAQLLAYPPLDPLCRAASYDRGSFPTRSDLRFAWEAYRGPAQGERIAAYATPWEVADLAGAAPAVLAVGELDPVLDDVRTYAGRLAAAGVGTELRVFTDTAHGAFLGPGPNTLRCWLARTLRKLIAPAAQGAEGRNHDPRPT